MTSCRQKGMYGRNWILNFEGLCTMFDSLYSQQNFSSTASLVDNSNVKQWKANIISTFAHTVDHNWETENKNKMFWQTNRSQTEQEVESERAGDCSTQTQFQKRERHTHRDTEWVSEWVDGWVRVSAWERERERERERGGVCSKLTGFVITI